MDTNLLLIVTSYLEFDDILTVFSESIIQKAIKKRTPPNLDICIIKSYYRTINYLIQKNTPGKIWSKNTMSLACKYNHLKIIQYLLTKKYKPKKFHIETACRLNHYAMVKVLLSYVKPDISIFYALINNNNYQMIKLLYENKIYPGSNQICNIIIKYNDYHLLDYLTKVYPSLENYNRLYQYANLEIIIYLVGKKIWPTKDIIYLLCNTNGDLEKIKFLLQAGFPADYHCIESAICEGNFGMLKLLCEAGVEVLPHCLRLAVRSKHVEIVKYLLQLIPNPLSDIIEDAVLSGNFEIVKTLYNRGFTFCRKIIVDQAQQQGYSDIVEFWTKNGNM